MDKQLWACGKVGKNRVLSSFITNSLVTCWSKITVNNLPPHMKKMYLLLVKMFSDPTSQMSLGECNIFLDLLTQKCIFTCWSCNWSLETRAKSVPGLSGTLYKIFKNCPKLILRLWKFLRTFCRKTKIPVATGWRGKRGRGWKLQPARPVLHDLLAVPWAKDFLNCYF